MKRSIIGLLILFCLCMTGCLGTYYVYDPIYDVPTGSGTSQPPVTQPETTPKTLYQGSTVYYEMQAVSLPGGYWNAFPIYQYRCWQNAYPSDVWYLTAESVKIFTDMVSYFPKTAPLQEVERMLLVAVSDENFSDFTYDRILKTLSFEIGAAALRTHVDYQNNASYLCVYHTDTQVLDCFMKLSYRGKTSLSFSTAYFASDVQTVTFDSIQPVRSEANGFTTEQGYAQITKEKASELSRLKFNIRKDNILRLSGKLYYHDDTLQESWITATTKFLTFVTYAEAAGITIAPAGVRLPATQL